MNKSTLVYGASDNPERYSYKVTSLLQDMGYSVHPVGVKKGNIRDLTIINELIHVEDLDTLTLYVNKTIQDKNEDYLLSLRPKRVIFNPGTEHMSLANKFKEQGAEVDFACTLVMLRTGQY